MEYVQIQLRLPSLRCAGVPCAGEAGQHSVLRVGRGKATTR